VKQDRLQDRLQDIITERNFGVPPLQTALRGPAPNRRPHIASGSAVGVLYDSGSCVLHLHKIPVAQSNTRVHVV